MGKKNRPRIQDQSPKSGFFETVFGIPKIRADIEQLSLTVKAFEDRLGELKTLEARVAKIGEKIDSLTEIANARVKELEGDAKKLNGEKDAILLESKNKERAVSVERGEWKKTENSLIAKMTELESEIAELRREKSSIFLPNSAMAVFGLTREDVEAGAGREKFASVRAWCDFLEWSEGGDATNFVRQFRRVDGEVGALEDRDLIRGRMAAVVRDTVSKNLKAAFEVSWDFIEQVYDEERHYSSEGGTEIVAVHGALIARDGKVLEKARVACT